MVPKSNRLRLLTSKSGFGTGYLARVLTLGWARPGAIGVFTSRKGARASVVVCKQAHWFLRAHLEYRWHTPLYRYIPRTAREQAAEELRRPDKGTIPKKISLRRFTRR